MRIFCSISGKCSRHTLDMDISRLPTALSVQPVSSFRPNTRQAVPPAGSRDVESADSRHRTPASSGSVLQGELLHRDRGQYQSTRAFLDERALGQARPAAAAHVAIDPPRAALSSYLQHSGPQFSAELSRGHAVNLVV